MDTDLEKLYESMKKYNKETHRSCSVRLYADGSCLFYKDYDTSIGNVKQFYDIKMLTQYLINLTS